MIHLRYANRTEALLNAFVDRVREVRMTGSAIAPLHVIVPSRHVERFIEVRCAEAMGISANFRFHRLESFVSRWLFRTHGHRPLARRAYEAGTLAALLDDEVLRRPALGPVADYLAAAQDDSTRDASRAQLAMRMAALFEGYALSRPELVAGWRSGRPFSDIPDEDARWQAALFDEVCKRTGAAPLAEHLRQLDGTQVAPLPRELHLFGLSYVARVYGWAFGALGAHTDLHLYTLNPCMEFWEDVPTEHELRRRGLSSLPRRAEVSADGQLESHPLLEQQGDPPALTYWGRPGREHVLLLNELTGADFEPCFQDPLAENDSLLARLQSDILHRQTPVGSDDRTAPDDSIAMVGCASVRRELEIVAEAIWAAVRADPSLRFNEIAVFVPPGDRGMYLPHLTHVFGEAQSLPHHVVDLPLATESRLVEAATRLVDLPLTAMRRPDLLQILMHPTTYGPTSPARWSDLVDRLGIFHGLDAQDHEGTYVGGDLLNWDQGVRRLTLGAFLEGEDPIEIDGTAYFPVQGDEEDEAPRLATLIRSICADVRFARAASLPLAEWSAFFGGLFRSYLLPRDAREESELRRCLRAAEGLAEGGLDSPVRYRLAAELLQASLQRLGGARGEYLADGVVVSALAPMRAIPFRRIFILGLGEGRFPSSERRDPLDLRNRKRRLGDVTPSERDKYVFLEALLSARQGIHLSWVSRDALTGDTIPPSPVLTQLQTMLRAYLSAPQGSAPAALVAKSARRRHEAAHADVAIRESLAEAKAASLGYRMASGDRAGRDLSQDTPYFPGGTDEHHAPSEPEVRSLLRLSSKPAATQTVARELTLASLRYFLESPAQGWARAVLRLDQPREEARAGQTDEPLRAEALERAVTLRDAFETALTERRPPLSLYNDEAKRLAAVGRWPLGILGERAQKADERRLDAWRRAYMNAVSAHGPPVRVRFGDGARTGERSLRAPAITLEVPVDGELVPVRLVGRTEALVDGAQRDETQETPQLMRGPAGCSSLILIARDAPSGGHLVRERLRYALRGYFDALVLAILSQEARPHRALVLYAGETAREVSTRFVAIDAEEARRQLTLLSSALLSRSHAYYLPADAVFRLARSWPTATEERLEAAIAQTRRDKTAAFGPLRGAEHLPTLPSADAFAAATTRFNPFFAAIGMGIAGTDDDLLSENPVGEGDLTG